MQFDLLLWDCLAGAILAWALRDLWGRLQKESAPKSVFAIVVGIHSVWAFAAVGSVLGWLPWSAPLVACVLLILPYVFSSQLVSLAGGPTNKEQMRRAYRKMQETIRANGGATPDVERARRQAKALDRYRTTETSEWIDLVQAQVLDRIEHGDAGGPEAAERRGRMVKLGEKLFLTSPRDPESANAEVHKT